jgi:hypothetical protein
MTTLAVHPEAQLAADLERVRRDDAQRFARDPAANHQAALVTALWCCHRKAYFDGHIRRRDQFGFAADFTVDLAAAARAVAAEISPALTCDERLRIASTAGQLPERQWRPVADRHGDLTARLREAYRQARAQRAARESRKHFRGDRGYRH